LREALGGDQIFQAVRGNGRDLDVPLPREPLELQIRQAQGNPEAPGEAALGDVGPFGDVHEDLGITLGRLVHAPSVSRPKSWVVMPCSCFELGEL
jgi:hypothetical protein